MKDYLRELQHQCQFGLAAATQVNASLQTNAGKHDLPKGLDPQLEVFRNIHSLVTQAANVSKLLWPTRPPRVQDETTSEHNARCKTDPTMLRGKMLRETFRLPKDAQELEKRDLRNALDHFDTRLDEWRAENPNGSVMDLCIGNVPQLDGATSMRHFNPTTAVFTCWDTTYCLNKIYEGLVAVLQGIERWHLKQMTRKERERWRATQEMIKAALEAAER